jgi:hypothetical protein
MLKWFHNFITQHFCATKFENEISKYMQTRSGPPQGAVTRTTLFNVMINKLSAQLGETKNFKSVLLADDLVTSMSLKKHKKRWISKIMTEALTTLSNWRNENAITIKTFYHIFTQSHNNPISA